MIYAERKKDETGQRGLTGGGTGLAGTSGRGHAGKMKGRIDWASRTTAARAFPA
jgi:hypothetical protein